jgi:hypothetical protein
MPLGAAAENAGWAMLGHTVLNQQKTASSSMLPLWARPISELCMCMVLLLVLVTYECTKAQAAETTSTKRGAAEGERTLPRVINSVIAADVWAWPDLQ